MDVSTTTYSQALTDVRARVANSRTSFHAGMAILPKARREAMYALYAFCREVDDIADESPTPEVASRGLAMWRERIANVFNGQASDSITTALLPAINNFGLVEQDFQAIIDGMEMDSVVICAPDDKTLDLYCDRVASAVGRVSVRIFGDASVKAMEVAHYLGRALQTTNILRDLAEDSVRGRLYLPEELLNKHRITSRNPAEILCDRRLSNVCREMSARAREYFAAADRAMSACIPSAMRPARVMRAYYGAILDRLIFLNWQDPLQRVRLPMWKKILLVLRYGVF